MLWTSGNIELRIWPLDHCPPHVTAISRADKWTARFEFSMLTDVVTLLDVKPKQNAPTRSVLNGLSAQVHVKRLTCRAEWWRLHQTVCLDNASVTRLANGSVVLAGSGPAAIPSGNVMKGTGIYMSGQGVQVRVDWGGHMTTELLQEV
jgi:hypothetical protein